MQPASLQEGVAGNKKGLLLIMPVSFESGIGDCGEVFMN
jgi:hypothetical protein